MTGKRPEEHRQGQETKDFSPLPKNQQVLHTLYASSNESSETINKILNILA